jgi:hypothetical protein
MDQHAVHHMVDHLPRALCKVIAVLAFWSGHHQVYLMFRHFILKLLEVNSELAFASIL